MNSKQEELLLSHNFYIDGYAGEYMVSAINRQYKIIIDNYGADNKKINNIKSQGFKYFPYFNDDDFDSVWMYLSNKYNIISNIADEFKGKTHEQIQKELKHNSFPFAVLLQNVNYNLNIGNVIRSANAFGARDIYYYGKKKIDRRGCVGTYLYSDVTHLSTLEEVKKVKDSYKLVALDNSPSSRPTFDLKDFQPNPMTCFVIGEEQIGISQDMLELCDAQVYIKQFGSVRSINLAVAAGIAMNHFVTKHCDALNAALAPRPAGAI